jgi:uncharacterized protein YqgC (DUF456 family)
MNWVYYFLLLALLVCGLGIQLMNLPGLWLMAAAAGLYAMITPEHYLWPGGIVTVLALCLVGELMELIAGAGGAKKAGGSKRAMALATVGGIVGGIVLSIPVPVIGTVAGVCIGAFAGATVAQLSIARDVSHSMLVGIGAAKGTLIGIVLKLCVGVIILIVVACMALPFGRAATAPTTSPTTSPTTLPAVEAA